VSSDAGVAVASLLTLAAWSYLYKQNIVFQVVEQVFIGISAAHAMTVAYSNIVSTGVKPLFQNGDLTLALPLAGGVLLYTRFWPKASGLSRLPLAFTMGTAAAVAIRGSVDASFIQQVKATMLPLNSRDNILVVAGTVSVIAYFLFNSKSRRGCLMPVSQVGRWVMMLAFGAAYGNTVMMRMSLLIPRMRLVFSTWLGLTP
jgi:hypothetical protein